MKLDPWKINVLYQLGYKTLLSTFSKYGHDVRVVGGGVRDLLLGIEPKDLDFATTATVTEMKSMFKKEEIRMINCNGEQHGTVTVRLGENNYECTALEFYDNPNKEWRHDASRRDLTINAMYVDKDGIVYDYFNGIEDLKNRNIVFVGNPEDRIKEDYLRILRYFRFHSQLSKNNVHNKINLESIKVLSTGLKDISAERIISELKKIIKTDMAPNTLVKMKECNLFPYIGIKNIYNLNDFTKAKELCKGENIPELVLFMYGFETPQDAVTFCDEYKLSKKEKELGQFLIEHKKKEINVTVLISMYVDFQIRKRNSPDKTNKYFETLLKCLGKVHLMDEISKEKAPQFPITGHDLMNRLLLNLIMEKPVSNKMRGVLLIEMVNVWEKSGFIMGKIEILDKIIPLKENSTYVKI